MHHLWVHRKARSFLMELRCNKHFPINNLWFYDTIFSLECITTNVEKRNGMMLDSAITKQFAVRMGSTKLVKIEQTLTILLPILFNILKSIKQDPNLKLLIQIPNNVLQSLSIVSSVSSMTVMWCKCTICIYWHIRHETRITNCTIN